ncbi:MAG: hypothetical protein AAFQ85_02755 [Pseudomonadota bacterium]
MHTQRIAPDVTVGIAVQVLQSIRKAFGPVAFRRRGDNNALTFRRVASTTPSAFMSAVS